MRNFIIIFDGKEGTSPLVRLLNNFNQISVIHQVNSSGWEPFDKHNCGSMPLKNLEKCLETIYNNKSIDFQKLNNIYCKTAMLPLNETSKDGVVGLKMRFNNYRENPLYSTTFPTWNRLLRGLLKIYSSRSYKNMIIDLLKRNDIVVFFPVRQDILRWGLSRYHGDGTGKGGHLQFDLASGKISREQIGKMHVDCLKLNKFIIECKNLHAQKRKLIKKLTLAKIQVHPLCYENFLKDKQNYFKQIFEYLELKISNEEIINALNDGAYFKKVHSDDISNFVVNHQEVLEKFGNSFRSWC
jgi:hypothetical protein